MKKENIKQLICLLELEKEDLDLRIQNQKVDLDKFVESSKYKIGN